MNDNEEKLLNAAKEARANSYSPYSHFAVGAAVLARSGAIYLGANIENASYPLCMCAERNALYNALNHGEKKEDLLMLAVLGDTPEPISPCGACRQVFVELLAPSTPILCANLKGDLNKTTPQELLPGAFTGDVL